MADIRMIMELTGCSQDRAEEALSRTGNVMAALDSLIEQPKPKYQLPARRKYQLDPVQEHLAQIRKVMENLENARTTSANPPGYEGQVELIDRPAETAPQSNCSPECQQPALQ